MALECEHAYRKKKLRGGEQQKVEWQQRACASQVLSASRDDIIFLNMNSAGMHVIPRVCRLSSLAPANSCELDHRCQQETKRIKLLFCQRARNYFASALAQIDNHFFFPQEGKKEEEEVPFLLDRLNTSALWPDG